MTEPRLVRCQYSHDPHPLEDECADVTDAGDEASFLAGAREAHDATPDLWHREMLKPPRTRSTACEFCGEPWTDEELVAGLRRVFAEVDGPPPAATARLDGRLPCCDLHNEHCEPPADLCCRLCTEAAHPGHLDGSGCVIDVDPRRSR